MRHPKILVVDDDPNLTKLYESALKSRGYRVLVEHNGEDALRAVDKESPDLVMMDVMMPQLHGFHTLDILKSTPETSYIKVMMLTALSDEASKERAKKHGADAYLIKTEVTIGDILQKVDNLLS